MKSMVKVNGMLRKPVRDQVVKVLESVLYFITSDFSKKLLVERSIIFILLQIFFYHLAMATHSNTLAWQIPWTEESGRLQSMGSLGVGHD